MPHNSTYTICEQKKAFERKWSEQTLHYNQINDQEIREIEMKQNYIWHAVIEANHDA